MNDQAARDDTTTSAQAAAPDPRRRPPAPPITRHLVLVNQPGWQSVDDLFQIARKVRWLDPSIAVFVVTAEVNDILASEKAAERPSLVVSFGPLGNFAPRRGKVYAGHQIAKLEQLRRLATAGVPVPRTAYLTAQTPLDPALWGEFVILKPSDIATSSHGLGFQLMRTSRVRYRPPEDYPEDHPARRGPMIVQQFVDTGEHVESFRVLLLFGEPLYCSRSVGRPNRVSLDAPDEVLESAMVYIQGLSIEDRLRNYVFDADVIMTARRAAGAVPDVPLVGCDVIRDHRNGRVYVLELNPGGNTWHFSSQYFAASRAAEGELSNMRLKQFDALNLSAHVLVQRTRAEAE